MTAVTMVSAGGLGHHVPAEVVMDPNLSPKAHLALLVDGYQATQLLFVAVDLGLEEKLADGPRTAAELAAETGVDPTTLYRVLRGLASFGVLEEPDAERFALSAVGENLRAYRGLLLARGEVYYGAFGKLRDTVRGGGNAFELAYEGRRFFEYLNDFPEKTAAFQQSMSDRSSQEAAQVVAAYDFGRFRKLIDIAGGRGVLISAIAKANPALATALFDQPLVAGDTVELPENCETIAGDFFAEVPAGADGYIISRVIHDWGDEEAVRILANTRKAMPTDGTLLLVEALLPEKAAAAPAAVRMDVNMLAMFNGKERTRAEFADLLGVAGFRLSRVIPVDESVGLNLLEAHPG
jgi:hypothetical protein